MGNPACPGGVCTSVRLNDCDLDGFFFGWLGQFVLGRHGIALAAAHHQDEAQ